MSIINNISEDLKTYASNANGRKSLIALGAEFALGTASCIARSKGKTGLTWGLLGLTAASCGASRYYANKAEEDFDKERFNEISKSSWDAAKVKGVNNFKQQMDERIKNDIAPTTNE